MCLASAWKHPSEGYDPEGPHHQKVDVRHTHANTPATLRGTACLTRTVHELSRHSLWPTCYAADGPAVCSLSGCTPQSSLAPLRPGFWSPRPGAYSCLEQSCPLSLERITLDQSTADASDGWLRQSRRLVVSPSSPWLASHFEVSTAFGVQERASNTSHT